VPREPRVQEHACHADGPPGPGHQTVTDKDGANQHPYVQGPNATDQYIPEKDTGREARGGGRTADPYVQIRVNKHARAQGRVAAAKCGPRA